MSRFYITIEMRAQSQINVGALAIISIAGIDAHQTTFRILTIECSLWTTENIYTAGLIMVKIESSLAQHRNSVKINSYSRTVDTASNAAHIHGVGKTRSIVGHYEVRNIAGKFTQIARTQSLHLIRTKGSAAERLLTKTEILLRLRNNHNFINIINSAAISQQAISSRKLFTRTQ